MFSLSEFFTGLRGNHLRILRQCKRYTQRSFEEHAEEFRSSIQRNRRLDAYENIPENEPEKYEHPDELEFRNIGQFQVKGVHPKHIPSFIAKDSILYNIKAATMVGTLKNILKNIKVKDESYNPDRVLQLGPDLAAAHFVVCRGGGVKFVGENKFVRGDVNMSSKVLPSEKDPNYKLEAIDFSGTNFIHEALSNLMDLKYLSWVSFKNCLYFDNWYLDHLSSVAPTIEYLDLSGCTKIDQYGLGCLYRFRKLKCVNVEGTNDTNEFKLACLTLEAEFPDFVFAGLRLKPTPKSVFND